MDTKLTMASSVPWEPGQQEQGGDPASAPAPVLPLCVCVCMHMCACAWIFSCSMLNYRNPNEVHKKIYSISDMFCMCVTMMEIVSSLNYHEVHKCVNET